MSVNFSQLILHGADHLHMAPLPPRCRPPCPPGTAIGKINIWDGQGFGLAQSIQSVECRGVLRDAPYGDKDSDGGILSQPPVL